MIKIAGGIEKPSEKIKEVLKPGGRNKENRPKIQEQQKFSLSRAGMNFRRPWRGAETQRNFLHSRGRLSGRRDEARADRLGGRKYAGWFLFLRKTRPTIKFLSNMEEIKARKGIIIAIVNEKDRRVEKLSDFIIKRPKASDYITPIINAIPLQLLAYYIADYKGIDVDKPRNLAKSVTVE